MLRIGRYAKLTAKLIPTSRFTSGNTSLEKIKATGPSPKEYA
jgi:hypothetical protein